MSSVNYNNEGVKKVAYKQNENNLLIHSNQSQNRLTKNLKNSGKCKLQIN